MTAPAPQRFPIFPLAGAILFPRMLLPLHIFEPRYRQMVADALAGDRRIAMIQPRGEGPVPPLYEIGCIGHLAEVEPLENGCFNILLEGVARFRLRAELPVTTPYRQVEGDLDPFGTEEIEALPAVVRADFEREAQRFAKARGILVNWEDVAAMDDESLINAAAQIAPFDVPSRQALLEAPTLANRTELMVQLMHFYARQGEDNGSLLQ